MTTMMEPSMPDAYPTSWGFIDFPWFLGKGDTFSSAMPPLVRGPHSCKELLIYGQPWLNSLGHGHTHTHTYIRVHTHAHIHTCAHTRTLAYFMKLEGGLAVKRKGEGG